MNTDINAILNIEDFLKNEISKNNKWIIFFNIIIPIVFILSFITIIYIREDNIIISLVVSIFVLTLIAYTIYSLFSKKGEYIDAKNYYSKYLLYVKSFARRNYNIHLEINLEQAIKDCVLYRDTFEEDLELWISKNDTLT